jgi:hypothetical protein
LDGPLPPAASDVNLVVLVRMVLGVKIVHKVNIVVVVMLWLRHAAIAQLAFIKEKPVQVRVSCAFLGSTKTMSAQLRVNHV